MPALLYGTAWKKERTAALVSKALQVGFRGIDTACQPKHYNEAGVGEALASAYADIGREQIFVQTKFTPISGHDPERVPYDARSPIADQVAQSFATSLRNLRTAWIDSLVLHSPLATVEDTLEAWTAMEDLLDSQHVKQLGISNCYDVQLLELLFENARVQPAVVQNRFFAQTGYDRELRAFCRANEVVYQSFWTLTANPHILSHSQLQALARTYERTPAQILFRYLTQAGVVPLTGTTNERHMREDLEIFAFSLTAQECGHLERIFR